jgi:hypothetical protein
LHGNKKSEFNFLLPVGEVTCTVCTTTRARAARSSLISTTVVVRQRERERERARPSTPPCTQLAPNDRRARPSTCARPRPADAASDQARSLSLGSLAIPSYYSVSGGIGRSRVPGPGAQAICSGQIKKLAHMRTTHGRMLDRVRSRPGKYPPILLALARWNGLGNTRVPCTYACVRPRATPPRHNPYQAGYVPRPSYKAILKNHPGGPVMSQLKSLASGCKQSMQQN